MNRRDRYRAVAEENLAIFHSGGYTTPDGEWYGLEPDRVARTFVSALGGKFAGCFRRVHFAVPSRFDQACFDAFASVIPKH